MWIWFVVAAGLTGYVGLKDPPNRYWFAYLASHTLVAACVLVLMTLHARGSRDAAMTEQRWWNLGLTIQLSTIVAIGVLGTGSAIALWGMRSGGIDVDGPRGGALPLLFGISSLWCVVAVVVLTGRMVLRWDRLAEVGRDPLRPVS